MQDWPLTVDRIIDHAVRIYGDTEVVARHTDGTIHRSTYVTIHRRAKQVSAALQALGIGFGDRVATLAWNSERHMECWYGTMGIGAVLHTINPRLHADQLVWIANHASDRVLILDTSFVGMIEAIRDRLPFEHYVIIADSSAMPANSLNALCYEDWIAGQDTNAVWGGFAETTAAGLCYTSGTTGNPKGVLYSHRSNVLHSMLISAVDALAIGPREVVMPVVPMFHANAWGLAFACPASGARMVMPGGQLDGASIYELLDSERVTLAAAVPTVWFGLLDHLRANDLKLPHLKRVIIGGAALPEAILRTFEEDYGVEIMHGWGMTETSPMGTITNLPPAIADGDAAERRAYKLKQGRPPFGVEIKIVDESGAALPRDGEAQGRLMVRGFAVAAGYFVGDGPDKVLDADGYFDTGDVATIDALGTMQITDRAKDVIKSGGEWISSIAIENIAMLHPAVANAAAIGMPDPKWDERPVLVIQLRDGAALDGEAMRAHLEGKIAKWWMPDEFIFIDQIPIGATGKVNKVALREFCRSRSRKDA
jgi:fatty-acyl-CoA synthase